MTLAVLALWLIILGSPGIRVQANEDPHPGIPTILRANPDLLDLARAVPYPADFGEVLPNSGWLDGRFVTLDEEAARIADADGEATVTNVRDIRRNLVAAGWLQRYESRIAVPHADDPSLFTIQVASFAVQYGLEADAHAAFETLPGGDAEVAFPRIGDESVLTLVGGVAADTGSDYQAARVFFRTGPIIGGITYADLQGQPPDLTLLDSVAQHVAARTVMVNARQTVPLGAMVLRLDPSSASGHLIQREMYDVRAGILTPLYADDNAAPQDRVRRFTGPTDAFTSTTTGTVSLLGHSQGERGQDPAESAPTSALAGDEETGQPSLAATPEPSNARDEHSATAGIAMTSALFAFLDEREANAWLLTQREQVVAETPADTLPVFTEIPQAPAVGDTSVTFASQGTGGSDEHAVNGFRIYAQVGAIVALLEMQGPPGVSLTQATQLMHQQVERIEAESAPAPLVDPPPTVAPLFVPATPPVSEPPSAPHEELILLPVEEVTPSLPEEATPADVDEAPPPAEDAISEPTAAPTPASAEEATPPNVEELTPAPVEEATSVPSEEPTLAAAAEPTPVSAAGPTPAPAEEPTATPASERVIQEDDVDDDERSNELRDNDGRRRDREKGRNRD